VRPKAKRQKCHICLRTRLRKFIEWHPGILEWMCSDYSDCDLVADAKKRKG
jgi:hypothetical protein